MEALRIANHSYDFLINQKGEWGLNMVPTMGTVVMGGLGEWEAENKADQPGNVGDSGEARNVETSETGTFRQRKRRRKNARELENVSAGSQKLV